MPKSKDTINGTRDPIQKLLERCLQEDLPTETALRQMELVLWTFREFSLDGQSDEYELRTILNIGRSYERLGGLTGALECYQDCIQLAIRLGDAETHARCLNRTGWVYALRSEWPAAVEALDEAERMYEELGHEAGLADVFAHKGKVYAEQGNYDRAEEHFTRSLEIGRKLGNLEIMGVATNSLGILASMRGDLEGAMVHYRDAVTVYQQMDNPTSLAKTYHNIGMLHMDCERWTEALDSFEQSLEITTEHGELGMMSITYLNKAEVYFALSDLSVAASYCGKALRIFEELADKLGEAEAQRVLGMVFTKKEQWSAALGLFEDSLALSESCGNPLDTAETYRELGRMYVAKGDRDPARKAFVQALDRFRQVGAERDVEETEKLLSDLDRSTE